MTLFLFKNFNKKFGFYGPKSKKINFSRTYFFRYVLGSMPIFIDQFRMEFQNVADQLTAEHIVLLMDSCFSHEQEKVAAVIKEVLPGNRHVECSLLPSEDVLKQNRQNVRLFCCKIITRIIRNLFLKLKINNLKILKTLNFKKNYLN